MERTDRRHRRYSGGSLLRNAYAITTKMPDSTSKRHIGKPIRKKLVTDEDHRPVAVQIDYEDWLDIEQRLSLEAAEPIREDLLTPADVAGPHWRGSDEDFDRLLDDTKDLWPGEDGLDYQRRLRAEWDRPWDAA